MLVTLDAFRSALVNLEGKVRAVIGDLSDADIVASIEAWRRRIALDLAQLVDSEVTSDTAAEILTQVRAIFRCRKCGNSGGGLTSDSAYDHRCLKRELKWPLDDEETLPSRQLVALDCEEIALAVADAVGFDPDVVRLDDVVHGVFLLDASDEHRIHRHLRERLSSQPHSFADLVRRQRTTLS